MMIIHIGFSAILHQPADIQLAINAPLSLQYHINHLEHTEGLDLILFAFSMVLIVPNRPRQTEIDPARGTISSVGISTKFFTKLFRTIGIHDLDLFLRILASRPIKYISLCHIPNIARHLCICYLHIPNVSLEYTLVTQEIPFSVSHKSYNVS